MHLSTDYTRDAYRDINRSLLNGVVTEGAAQLIEALSDLPAMPGKTYRTFSVDNLEEFAQMLKTGIIRFRAFTSSSRSAFVANQFNGNVQLTIDGFSGRDVAPFSDAPNEVETLFLPDRVFRVKRVRVKKFMGVLGSIEAELTEIQPEPEPSDRP